MNKIMVVTTIIMVVSIKDRLPIFGNRVLLEALMKSVIGSISKVKKNVYVAI